MLDIIDIPVRAHQPEGHQTENWLISHKRWRKVGRFPRERVHELVDPAKPLWIVECMPDHESNDKIPVSEAGNLTDSLRLIEVERLKLYSTQQSSNRRRLRGQFDCLGVPYNLSVTDDDFERECFRRPDDKYSIGQRFITVSLARPFECRWCYKLIAAVIDPDCGH